MIHKAVDDFDCDEASANATATTITAVSNATLTGGSAADVDATVYIISTYATLETSLATLLGTMSRLDAALATSETVLLNVDDGTNFVVHEVTIQIQARKYINSGGARSCDNHGGADDLVTGDFI